LAREQQLTDTDSSYSTYQTHNATQNLVPRSTVPYDTLLSGFHGRDCFHRAPVGQAFQRCGWGKRPVTDPRANHASIPRNRVGMLAARPCCAFCLWGHKGVAHTDKLKKNVRSTSLYPFFNGRQPSARTFRCLSASNPDLLPCAHSMSLVCLNTPDRSTI
jgi:hypothetical protein